MPESIINLIKSLIPNFCKVPEEVKKIRNKHFKNLQKLSHEGKVVNYDVFNNESQKLSLKSQSKHEKTIVKIKKFGKDTSNFIGIQTYRISQNKIEEIQQLIEETIQQIDFEVQIKKFSAALLIVAILMSIIAGGQFISG